MEENNKSLMKKNYPEIGKDYAHYKGGRYTVLTMAKHSEVERMKVIFERLEKQNLSPEGKGLINELQQIVLDDQVVYKSVHFGSVHTRPLFMWFQDIINGVIRFKEIK